MEARARSPSPSWSVIVLHGFLGFVFHRICKHFHQELYFGSRTCVYAAVRVSRFLKDSVLTKAHAFHPGFFSQLNLYDFSTRKLPNHMASKMPKVDTSKCVNYKTKRQLVDSESECARLTGQTNAFLKLVKLKTHQFHVTSALYMLDWWERIICYLVVISFIVATLILMYTQYTSSMFLVPTGTFFVCSIILFCPIHQY